MEKMTNRKALEFVLGLEEVVENVPVYDKIAKMLEQVEKKSNSGKSGKPSKAQLENEKIKEVILEVLREIKEPKQIKELQENGKLSCYSNQKLSSLIRQLIAENKVLRVEEKKVAMFKIA